MKKISYLFVVFVIMFQIFPTFTASAAVPAYSGGLLDNLPLKTAQSVNDTTLPTITELTDNNVATFKQMGTNIAWYTFSTPQDINEVIINNYSTSYKATVEFYDINNNKLGEYTPLTNDGVETLPSSVTGVSTVVLKKAASSSALYIREFNVYTTPTAVPNVPTITFTAAWDKGTEINWTSTGAKWYNIKRSISATGPFANIATSIKDTTYSDSTVTNGTTYYYVVTANNEFGESGQSNVSTAALPNATKYTGGLLDRLPINVGVSVGATTTTIRELTDNNVATFKQMGTNIAWYTFSTPQDINGVIINNYSTSYKATVEFYDINNNKLGEYTPLTNDGIETLPSSVTGVSTVVLKKAASSSALYIREFNVYTTPTAVPSVPIITFTAAWDKITEINWTSTGAKWYNVKRSTSATGPFANIATNIKGTTYSDSTVTNGTTYYYVVTANNEFGESGQSNVSNAALPNATKYTGGLLDRLPINIGVSVGATTTTIRELTDNNVATFKQMGTNIAWYTFSTPQDINEVIINNYSASYKATVEFYDINNNKLGEYTPLTNDGIEALPSPVIGVSTVVLKKTTSSSALYVREFNVFGQESPRPHLTAIAENAKVTLNWDDAVVNATGYIVKRSDTAGGPYTNIQTVTSITYTYLDTNVTNGTTYYYTVVAKIGTSESALSNEISATPSIEIKLPTNLTAVGGNKQVSLKWAGVNDATGYIVKRSTTTGGPYSKIATVPSTQLTYLDTNVVNGTTYYYVVTALFGATESANSNEASAKPVVDIVDEDNGDRALLSIMLNTGEEKEYDLSMGEVNDFIEWYEKRAAGVGSVTFAIDKHSNNKGPFKRRKDYIIYDKIITFEVNEYTTIPTVPTKE